MSSGSTSPTIFVKQGQLYIVMVRPIKLSVFSIVGGHQRNSWLGRTTNTIDAMVNQHEPTLNLPKGKGPWRASTVQSPR